MCHVSVLELFTDYTELGEFRNKRVLEVGSKYENGSVRPLIEKFCLPKEYIGVDVEPGKFVDQLLPAERILDYFGPESFDIVISTELLEHVRDWRLVVSNMKGVLKHEGHIYVTTRSKGFGYHGYPYDFWRYEPEDMKKIFVDFQLIVLKKDYEFPGVFLKGKKPKEYAPTDLSNIALYSMILGKRTIAIPYISDMSFSRKLALKVLGQVRVYRKRALSMFLRSFQV